MSHGIVLHTETGPRMVRQSVHQMLERGRFLPTLSGYQTDTPAWPQRLGRTRPSSVGYRPGTFDAPAGSRVPMPDMGNGTTYARSDSAERMLHGWKVVGPSGSRQEIRSDPRMWCPGVFNRVPVKHTPAAQVLESQRAVIGDGFEYGSPVTDFGRRVERQMYAGGRIPETGQIEVRRHTTTERSLVSEITPGANRRTAGFTTVTGAVPILRGTPVLSGVESIVENAQLQAQSGVPLAVGTESFASAASPGGPYYALPSPTPSPDVPKPSGLLLSAGDMARMHPGYAGQGKGGSQAMGTAPGVTATAATVEAPRTSLRIGLLALLGLAAYAAWRR